MNPNAIRVLSYWLPKTTAKLAYRALTTPQIGKLRPHELDVLETARQEKIKFGTFDIQTYQWGNPQHKKVLLVHGWEGQAGNFSDFIPSLLAHQYHVIAFDGPSHGFSSRGATSLFEFGDLTSEMLKKYQCDTIISHSFGGVATTQALSVHPDIFIKKYALLTTPDKFSERINYLAQTVGISEKVKKRLIQRLEAEMNIDVSEVSVSNFVQKVNVEEALILHDKNDRIISVEQSRSVAENWDNCRLKEVEGTGHFRILRTQSIIDEVIQFLMDVGR